MTVQTILCALDVERDADVRQVLVRHVRDRCSRRRDARRAGTPDPLAGAWAEGVDDDLVDTEDTA